MSKRDNVIVNRLNKTKREETKSSQIFREERESRDKSEREEKKKIFKQLEEVKSSWQKFKIWSLGLKNRIFCLDELEQMIQNYVFIYLYT